ncbi:MAG: flippase-like domain-containing protein [Gemmatimonadetes bacterium]|nr:flippase-like domain-containing protein [Gemmatimonadota bacterium]
MKLRHWLGILVSVLCLWWALKGVHWHEVRVALAAARLEFLLLAGLGSILVGVVLRALRWHVFLPRHEEVESAELINATGVGLMVNNVLPARIGEFVRAYVLARRTPIPLTTVIGSLFVERLFDAAVLVFFLVAGVLASDVPQRMVWLAWVGGAVLALLLLFEVLLLRFPERIIAVIRRLTAPLLPARWEAGLEGALLKFVDGLQPLRNPRRVLLAALFTFALWGANGFLYYLGLLAFGLERIGYGGAMLVQSVASLGVSVPSSPGFVGTFQAFVVEALAAFGVERDVAVGYSIAFHAAQYLPVTLYGFYLLGRVNLSWREIGRSEKRVERELADQAEVA